MPQWYKINRMDYWDHIDRSEARCKYMLPMATCPKCNDERGFPEVEYPEVKAERIFPKEELSSMLERRWPSSDWTTFVSLRNKLRSHLSPGAFLAPACGFGPMQAKIWKKFEGFGLAGKARLLASSEALDLIQKNGIYLATSRVEHVKQLGNGRVLEIYFIYASLGGDFPPRSGITVCKECCRPSRPQVEGMDEVLVSYSTPTDQPIFRLTADPMILIFRQDFVEILTKVLKIKALHFEPMEVV